MCGGYTLRHTHTQARWHTHTLGRTMDDRNELTDTKEGGGAQGGAGGRGEEEVRRWGGEGRGFSHHFGERNRRERERNANEYESSLHNNCQKINENETIQTQKFRIQPIDIHSICKLCHQLIESKRRWNAGMNSSWITPCWVVVAVVVLQQRQSHPNQLLPHLLLLLLLLSWRETRETIRRQLERCLRGARATVLPSSAGGRVNYLPIEKSRPLLPFLFNFESKWINVRQIYIKKKRKIQLNPSWIYKNHHQNN